MQDKRRLTLFDTVMIVSGSMIGSGIFIVSADMTRVLGSPALVLVCWAISGFITLLAALSYGELAGMMPQAGGQFIYIKRAFGKMPAFLYGWSVFTVIQTGVIAAVAVAFARFSGVFFDVFSDTNILFTAGGFSITSTQLLAVSLVLFLTWINTLGLENGKMIQRIFTSAKLVALLAVIITGICAVSGTGYWAENMSMPFKPFIPSTPYVSLASAIGVALIGSLFSSDAWNNVTFIAGEVQNPKRNIFLGLLIGVIIVTVLYMLANVAYFMLLPAGSADGTDVISRGVAFAENDRVGSAALYPVLGAGSVYFMAGLIVISTFGCNNGLILSGARLFQSMAAENLFFRAAGSLNKHQVPGKALWLQGIWAAALCLSGSYGNLLNYCTFASLLFYALTISGLFILRKKEPDTERPYRTFGYPFVPALYIVAAIAICINLLVLRPEHPLIGLCIIALGVPVYFAFRRSSKRRLNADVKTTR